jgi:DNA-binding NarL/FixJ family response regulator
MTLLAEGRHFERNKPLRSSILSTREEEVLEALADGLNIKEVSKLLFISSSTVDKHIGNSLEKTGTLSTKQLLYRWGRARLMHELIEMQSPEGTVII